jgi:hypothetical protein
MQTYGQTCTMYTMGSFQTLCKEHVIENVIKLFILHLSQNYDLIEVTSSIKNCKIKNFVTHPYEYSLEQ